MLNDSCEMQKSPKFMKEPQKSKKL